MHQREGNALVPWYRNQRKGGFTRKRVVSHVSAVKKLKEVADQEKKIPGSKSHDEEIIHLRF